MVREGLFEKVTFEYFRVFFFLFQKVVYWYLFILKKGKIDVFKGQGNLFWGARTTNSKCVYL